MKKIDFTDLEKTGRAFGTVTAEEYHQRFHTDAAKLENCISKSSLVEFAESPFLYRYNIENGIRKTSPGFHFGSLLDTLVLTPDEFPLRYKVDTPRVAVKKDGTPYANGMQDREQAAEWAELAAQGVTVISPEEMSQAEAARDKVNATLAKHGLILGDTFDSQVGLAFKMAMPVLGKNGEEETCTITVTGMIDILPRDPALPIIDLKTTSKPVHIRYEIDKQIRAYTYGWQAAFYADMVRAVMQQERFFRFLFVNSAAPHCRAWVDMQAAELNSYRAKYRPKLAEFAQCCHTNTWPGEELEPRNFQIAPWEEFDI